MDDRSADLASDPGRGRRFLDTAKGLLPQAGDTVFDRVAGTATAGREGPGALGFGPDRGAPYVATSWLVRRRLRRLLGGLGGTAADVFVDRGSGKGRVLVMAARYPFKRAVGVEVPPRLSAIAAANVQRHAHHVACGDVELVAADKATWAIPDDATVFYVCNPFPRPLFSDVLDRIGQSPAARPRRLALIDTHPVLHADVLGRGCTLAGRASSTHLYRGGTAGMAVGGLGSERPACSQRPPISRPGRGDPVRGG